MKSGFFSSLLYVLSFCILSFSAWSQTRAGEEYERNYFRNPLGIPMLLSANFGELRTDHWHMGLDIRTNRKENYRVYAAADGYIAFAGVRPLSFGRFLIINHPNGLSTLYAHLKEFSPQLEEYVVRQQKQRESWAVELTIPEKTFPVRKGDLIAYSGNTGGSQGPHLHFEIRKTATGECLNPLMFDFGIKDEVPPVFARLAMYDRGISIYEQKPALFTVKKTDSGYFTVPQLIISRKNKISFAIEAYDKVSNSANPQGIYSASFFWDEKPVTGFELKKIKYGETLYMNAHIDYSYKSGGGPYLQHLSKLPGDRSSVYFSEGGSGIIELRDTNRHRVRIQINDVYGNASHLHFMVQYRGNPDTPSVTPPDNNRFVPGIVNVFRKEDFEVYTTENSLYDTVALQYQRFDSMPEGAVTFLHRFHNPSVPVHDPFTVRIRPAVSVSEKFKTKTVMIRTWSGERSVRKAVWEGEWLTARFGDFGHYQAFIDSIPPSINNPGPVEKNDTLDLSRSTRIVFTPSDNFGIRSFRAELNGKWLMFSNDKAKSFIYVFDGQCPYGVHHLKVKAEDLAGNITEKTWIFKRYEYRPPVKRKPAARKSTSKKK